MSLKSCSELCNELYNTLDSQQYPQELLDIVNELSCQIEEYDKENPEDVPSVRIANQRENTKTESEYMNSKEMSPSDHKQMLKKNKIITISVNNE